MLALLNLFERLTKNCKITASGGPGFKIINQNLKLTELQKTDTLICKEGSNINNF